MKSQGGEVEGSGIRPFVLAVLGKFCLLLFSAKRGSQTSQLGRYQRVYTKKLSIFRSRSVFVINLRFRESEKTTGTLYRNATENKTNLFATCAAHTGLRTQRFCFSKTLAGFQ